MYIDYKGFVHADKNGTQNNKFHNLKEFAKYLTVDLNNRKVLGVNLEINNFGQITPYFILEEFGKKIVKIEIKDIGNNIWEKLFNQVSIMIYDVNIKPLPELEQQ